MADPYNTTYGPVGEAPPDGAQVRAAEQPALLDERPTRYGRKLEVYNVRFLSGRRRRTAAPADGPAGPAVSDGSAPDRAGGVLLAVASVLLLVLAVAQGYVSFRAQYTFVHAVKGEDAASMLEALGLDCAAVIFALLGLAQARLGRPALAERALNLACVVGSLAMNVMSADLTSATSIAVWALPAALYAAASDRLIAVVRRRALAGRTGTDERSPLAATRGLAMWLLRLVLDTAGTVKGFRSWVLDEAPVAPGRRARNTGHDTGHDTSHDTGRDSKGDTNGDTSRDADPDTSRDITGDSTSGRKGNGTGGSSGDTVARRSRRRTGAKTAKTATAERARVLLAAEPEMSGAELGRRLRVSDRTGQRLYAQLAADPATATTTTRPASRNGKGEV
ncbi:MAG TPA: hypothetical protein VFU43_29390 [Streptosporangiaceae bacterium]|nr:hypothetical protein [Streptosporangiaceae bacterium]